MVAVFDAGAFRHDGNMREHRQFHFPLDFVNDIVYYLLECGQSVSVIGAEKGGKTSFILHISHAKTVMDAAVAYEFTPCDHIFVHLECASMGVMDESGCFRCIKEFLEEQMLARDVGFASSLKDIAPSGAYAELCSALRVLKRATIRPIVVLDDFECLAENPRLSYRFFGSLRALSGNYDVVFLTTSKVALNELERGVPRIAGSPFFNIFLSYELPSLDHDEGR